METKKTEKSLNVSQESIFLLQSIYDILADVNQDQYLLDEPIAVENKLDEIFRCALGYDEDDQLTGMQRSEGFLLIKQIVVMSEEIQHVWQMMKNSPIVELFKSERIG